MLTARIPSLCHRLYWHIGRKPTYVIVIDSAIQLHSHTTHTHTQLESLFRMQSKRHVERNNLTGRICFEMMSTTHRKRRTESKASLLDNGMPSAESSPKMNMSSQQTVQADIFTNIVWTHTHISLNPPIRSTNIHSNANCHHLA